MMVNIAASSPRCSRQWQCLVEKVLGFDTRVYDPYHIGAFDQEMMGDGRFWIMEVWDRELKDPIGFRNAEALAGKGRMLLVFNRRPGKGFPDEGPFWVTYSFTGSIKSKIDSMISQPPVEKVKFEELLEKYPGLGKEPKRSHHH